MVKTVKNSQKTVKTAKFTIGVPIVTCLPRLYQQCTSSVPIVKNSQKTVKTAKITIGVPIVTCLSRLYQQYTNSVPIVKNSQKTVKTAKMTLLVYQSSQAYQDCSNSVPAVYQSSKTVKRQSKQQKMTIGVPIVTCLHRVRRIHKVRVRRPRSRLRSPNTQSPQFS